MSKATASRASGNSLSAAFTDRLDATITSRSRLPLPYSATARCWPFVECPHPLRALSAARRMSLTAWTGRVCVRGATRRAGSIARPTARPEICPISCRSGHRRFRARCQPPVSIEDATWADPKRRSYGRGALRPARPRQRPRTAVRPRPSSRGRSAHGPSILQTDNGRDFPGPDRKNYLFEPRRRADASGWPVRRACPTSRRDAPSARRLPTETGAACG